MFISLRQSCWTTLEISSRTAIAVIDKGSIFNDDLDNDHDIGHWLWLGVGKCLSGWIDKRLVSFEYHTFETSQMLGNIHAATFVCLL